MLARYAFSTTFSYLSRFIGSHCFLSLTQCSHCQRWRRLESTGRVRLTKRWKNRLSALKRSACSEEWISFWWCRFVQFWHESNWNYSFVFSDRLSSCLPAHTCNDIVFTDVHWCHKQRLCYVLQRCTIHDVSNLQSYDHYRLSEGV